MLFKGPLLYSTTNCVEHSDIKRTTTPNIFNKKSKESNFGLSRGRRTIEWEVDNFALYKQTKQRNSKIHSIFLNKTNYSTTAEKISKTVHARIYKIHPKTKTKI